MLNDVTGLKKIYLAAGYTDLRRGIDGLATMIRFRFHLDPYDKNTLFLFCGKRTSGNIIRAVRNVNAGPGDYTEASHPAKLPENIRKPKKIN